MEFCLLHAVKLLPVLFLYILAHRCTHCGGKQDRAVSFEIHGLCTDNFGLMHILCLAAGHCAQQG